MSNITSPPATAAVAIQPNASPALEPTTSAFIDSLAGSVPLYSLSPTAARAVLTGAQSSAKVMLADVTTKDVMLAVGPTGQTSIRVVRPEGAVGTLPAVIYMHGGGWVIGDKETHDRLIRELAVGSHAAVVFVDYARSPESRFPTAIEQGYAVAKHVADHADKLGVDANRLALAGDSVGGNMATVIALMAKERKGPTFCAQLLFYPVADATMSSSSYEQFAEGPWLTRKAMAWFWDQYLPDLSMRQNHYASPLNASLEQLAGLPPTLVIVDENDVLRDEGEAYARKLAEAGVEVTSLRFNGTIHDFMMLNALSSTPAARGAVGQAIGYLRKMFVRD